MPPRTNSYVELIRGEKFPKFHASFANHTGKINATTDLIVGLRITQRVQLELPRSFIIFALNHFQFAESWHHASEFKLGVLRMQSMNAGLHSETVPILE